MLHRRTFQKDFPTRNCGPSVCLPPWGHTSISLETFSRHNMNIHSERIQNSICLLAWGKASAFWRVLIWVRVQFICSMQRDGRGKEESVQRWVRGNCGNSVCKYVSLSVKFLPAEEVVTGCRLVSRPWEGVYGESTPGNSTQLTSLT